MHRVAVLCLGGTDVFRKGESLEDDVPTGRPQTVQTECKIKEVAMPLRANRS